MNFDLVIRGGTLVDGTGAPGVRADVGLIGDRIAATGNLTGADPARVLDATGKVVCPGFVDVHTHSELTLMADPRAESRVRQGVTTEVVGNCGFSPFPMDPANPDRLIGYELTKAFVDIDWDWTDLDGYARHLEAGGIALNVACLVGNAPIRMVVMGAGEGKATDEQLDRMVRLTERAMEQGAFGLSVGLTLVPSCFADTDELIALSRVVGKHGGLYSQHSRIWADWHEKTIHEAIRIGRDAACTVQISHQAIIDSRHWGEADRLVHLMQGARDNGLDLLYDSYPYVAAGSPFNQLLPLWVTNGGTQAMLERLSDPANRRRAIADTRKGWFGGLPFEWDKLQITELGRPQSRRYVGRTIADVAGEWNVEPAQVAVDLVIGERNVFGVVMFNRSEEDVRYFLKHPLGMVGSDGSSISPHGPFAGTKPHPRFYGCYPRILGKYVREEGVLTLEAAIHKMTGLPAARFHIRDRGTVERGKLADLVVFDPATVVDRATFDDPHNYPVGIEHVFVAGQAVVSGGEHTGALPGKVLRHQG